MASRDVGTVPLIRGEPRKAVDPDKWTTVGGRISAACPSTRAAQGIVGGSGHSPALRATSLPATGRRVPCRRLPRGPLVDLWLPRFQAADQESEVSEITLHPVEDVLQNLLAGDSRWTPVGCRRGCAGRVCPKIPVRTSCESQAVTAVALALASSRPIHAAGISLRRAVAQRPITAASVTSSRCTPIMAARAVLGLPVQPIHAALMLGRASSTVYSLLDRASRRGASQSSIRGAITGAAHDRRAVRAGRAPRAATASRAL